MTLLAWWAVVHCTSLLLVLVIAARTPMSDRESREVTRASVTAQRGGLKVLQPARHVAAPKVLRAARHVPAPHRNPDGPRRRRA
jgi:hypothetical protein